MTEAETEAPDSTSLIQVICCAVWAALVGVSVPLEIANTILLNSSADESDRRFHAFYVSNLAVLMGGIQLLPLSLKAGKAPATRPKKLWHLAGGICSLPAFFTISAGSKLGSSVVLVVQLAALISTFFLIDIVDGRVQCSQWLKVVALLIVFTGVVLESLGGTSVSQMDAQALVMLALVGVSGVGYALQAKCNNALAQDLGTAARATAVSACVNIIFSIPIDIYIYFGLQIPVALDTKYWYLWLVAGFQSAFYIGSMAYLPSVLGYTGCYVITLGAKLITSLMVDAYGLTGDVLPVTVTRVVAIVTVLLGSVMFNTCAKPKESAYDPGVSLNNDPRSEEEEPEKDELSGSMSSSFVLPNS